jgi:hypothetical protein
MRKGFKLAALASALSMVMGGSAMAANADLTFNGWTVDNGTIDYSSGGVCTTAGYSCSEIATGSGFKQVQVTKGEDNYVMTIVTDQTATAANPAEVDALGFYDVSYVRMGSIAVGNSGNQNVEGITGQQKISETSSDGTAFESMTDINTGWATDGNDPAPVKISQSLINNGDPGTEFDNFGSGFSYSSSNDVDGIRNGFEMKIDQVTGLNSSDDQVFALRQRQGNKLTGADSVTLAGNGTGVDNTGGTVSWDGAIAEDGIKSIWIGQRIDLGGVGSGDFGYVSYENTNDPGSLISEFALNTLDDAANWDAATGGSDLPCVSDLTGATCP